MGRSTTMQGVGRTSLVISRKSRLAMRVSNSENGKADSVYVAARPARVNRLTAAPPARNCRREVISKTPVWLLDFISIAPNSLLDSVYASQPVGVVGGHCGVSAARAGALVDAPGRRRGGARRGHPGNLRGGDRRTVRHIWHAPGMERALKVSAVS